MYSMEFFNRCNITQPDGSSQGLRQIHGGNFLVNKVNCLETGNALSRNMEADGTYRTSFTKKLNVRHLEVCKRQSSSLNGGAVGAASSIPAEDYPSYISKRDNGVLDNGPRDGASLYYSNEATEREELAAIRESALHSRFMGKLSEANLYGRHMQRQLLEKEAALLKCKSELASMETEIKALVGLAQEAARSEGAKPGSRKINGKYIQSHLALRLEELHGHLLLQVKDIEAVCYRDVPLVWYGMAQDVQVMGSFDGWTRGQQMSPENTGSFIKFSTTLQLRPGRYEIKFLVDGEWHLSPDWPSVGEGMTVNNLLVVE